MGKVTDINKFRAIVNGETAQKIDGKFIDLYSASAVVTVYDKLSEENRQKLMSFSLEKIIATSFKCVNKLSG